MKHLVILISLHGSNVYMLAAMLIGLDMEEIYLVLACRSQIKKEAVLLTNVLHFV